MTDRLQGMQRLLRLQGDIKRMADWRLAEAERASAEVEEAQRALAAFVDGEVLTGPLATAAIGQAKRLNVRAVAAVRRVESEADAMREATARQKLAGRMVEELGRAERAARERKDLERLIQGLAGREPATEP